MKYKPGVSVKTHHLAAAVVWSAVGIMLMVRGGLFLSGVQQMWLAIPAVVLGTVKSIFMLDKTAGKNLIRLAAKSDGACLGGVYSLKMWGLIVLMIFMGWLLRTSSAPRELVGFVYVAIGWALFFSSRQLWRGFQKISNQ